MSILPAIYFPPQGGDVVVAIPPPGSPGAVPSIIAYGSGDPGTTISGTLKNNAGVVVGSAMTLVQPPHWIILFADVPIGSDFAIEVVESNGATQSVNQLRLLGTFGLGIAHPKNNDTVCNNFASYGSTDDPTAIHGELVKNNVVLFSVGSVKDGPIWVVQFTAVTPGVTFDRLNVFGANAASNCTALAVKFCL